MNFIKLVKKVSDKTGFNEQDVKKILRVTFEEITDSLLIGEKVLIRGEFKIKPIQVKKGYILNGKFGKAVVKPFQRYIFSMAKTKKK